MNQLIDKYKLENNISKACYCGRLDPMARGQVLLLVEDECKDMVLYNKSNKTYKFEILFGISTDTDDVLGFIDNTQFISDLTSESKYITMIKDYINNIISFQSYYQSYHNYSSKRINGKPMWQYMKTETSYDIKPSHSVSLYDAIYHDIMIYKYNDWEKNVIDIIKKLDENIKVNFREKEIIKKYQELSIYRDRNIYSFPITITVSSGFYVRQLVADIKEHIQIPILTYDINRLDINPLANIVN
jgi:tRNA U55 pseudouridine synthase TruB